MGYHQSGQETLSSVCRLQSSHVHVAGVKVAMSRNCRAQKWSLIILTVKTPQIINLFIQGNTTLYLTYAAKSYLRVMLRLHTHIVSWDDFQEQKIINGSIDQACTMWLYKGLRMINTYCVACDLIIFQIQKITCLASTPSWICVNVYILPKFNKRQQDSTCSVQGSSAVTTK